MATTISTTNNVLRARSKQITLTDSAQIYANQAGSEINIATDAKVITLPLIDANNLGMEFTIRNTGADGNNIVTIAPNAADGFNGSITQAAAIGSASGTVDKDLINTKATALSGDFVTIKAIALTKWFITSGQGIWASQS